MKSGLFAFSLLFVASACGGSTATSGVRTTPTGMTERDVGHTSRCAIIAQTGDSPDDSMLLASIDDRFGIVLPGVESDWNPRCVDSDSHELFFAGVDGESGSLGVSLEEIAVPPITSFDERAFFGLFIPAMVEGRDAAVRSIDDIGLLELRNGHIAWFALYEIATPNGVLQSLHGYSVRQLASERVLIGHVSASAASIDREEATEMLKRILELYGSPEDIERLGTEAPAPDERQGRGQQL